MEQHATAPSADHEPETGDPDLLRRLQTWCEDLQKRVPGLIEVGLLHLDNDSAGRIAAAPETMPLDRIGYREALARMRAAKVAVLVPLDRTEDGIAEIVAMPIKGPGLDTPVVLLVGLAEMPAARIQLVMAQLEIAIGWVLHHLTMDTLAQTKKEMDIYDRAFLLCAEMLDTETPLEARQTMASLCARDLGCDRVVLVKRGFFGLTIQAISGETRFDRKSRINDLTRQAAHEAQLRRAPVQWNRGDQEKTIVLRRLGEMHGDAVVMAVPLSDANGKIDEVVILHWSTAEKVPELSAWSVLWALSRPILEQKDMAHRGFALRWFDSTKRVLKRLLGPRAFKLKLLVSVGLLAIYAILFVQVNDVLRADVVIDDPDLRVVSAPMDSFIKEVFVIPGDVVAVGDPLVNLEDDEILLRIAELEAQIARHVARAAVARSGRDRAEAAVAEAEKSEAEARLMLARRELDQTHVVARTAGTVLEGDLRQKLGARVSFGEELMRIAPRQGIEVQLSVRNRDGERLAQGLSGPVRLDAAPETSLMVTLTRLQPKAETIDGELRFVAFGELQAASGAIENGMQGTARLSLGKGPIYQVWLKPIAETVFMFLWRWMP